MSRFNTNPTISNKIPRSMFNRNSRHLTTFNAGLWIPIFCDEVLPGDTFNLKFHAVVRQTTMLFPVMDNAFLDVQWYYVPNRLVDEDWKKLMGENDKAWAQKAVYKVPQIVAPENGWEPLTLADYFGIPTKVPNLRISALPARAYSFIWNEWLRDENLQDSTLVTTNSNDVAGSNGDNYLIDPQLYGKPLPSNKYRDYFTSGLPSPQKGESVPIPFSSGVVPVKTMTNDWPILNDIIWPKDVSPVPSVRYRVGGTSGWEGNREYVQSIVTDNSPTDENYFAQGTAVKEPHTVRDGGILTPSNLVVDLSYVDTSTINDLRLASQIQKMLERDARGGTRYREMIKAHFGVTSPDARQQVPEFLGGSHQPLNVQQVPQTSSTTGNSPQANLAAFGLTNFSDSTFIKSFTEHGYIIGIATVRTEHTYQQGIERHFSRRTRTDFYLPVFANLGEQEILNKEIYAQGTSVDNQVHSYNERWAEMRYKPNIVSGAFRSNYPQTLDSWGYWDNYKELPKLSDGWIRETDKNIERTLAIKSEKQPQFFADFYFQNKCSRLMPMYSVPGNLDRN